MRDQCRKLGLNGSVLCVIRTDQNAVPVPAAGFRWLNQQQHLTLEEVCGQPTEHTFGEERRVLGKRLENPLVLKRLHVFESHAFMPTLEHTAGRPFIPTIHPVF
jgi:hypothetical protein